MSDRVRFLANNGSGGMNYSGANGFPFATTYSAPSSGNPVAVTYKDCIKWWWRVKNWKITTDAEIEDTDHNTFTFTNGNCTPAGGNATHELALIASVSHDFQTGLTGTYGNSFGLMGSSPRLQFNASNYYPNISISGFVQSPDSSKGWMEWTSLNPGGGAPHIVGQVDGYSVNLYYTFPSAVSSFTFSSLVLEPVEYWAYADAQGNPIYNTGTGVQLRSPLG